MHFSIIWLALIVVAAIVVWELKSKPAGTSRGWALAAIGFIIGLTVFGSYFLQSRKVDQGLRVTGYANKLFESDLVKWSLTVQKNAGTDSLGNTGSGSLKDTYTSVARDVGEFTANLAAQGLKAKDINVQPPTSSAQTDSYGNLTGYTVSQSIYVLSSDIPKVEKIALDPGFFAERGMLLQNSSLEYLYSKLPDLKKKLIAEATADALARAKEITNSAKSRLGKLTSARAGVFQITEPYSTDVSDYGYYSTSTRSKSISVTVAAEFEL